jgi:hypothetical protein
MVLAHWIPISAATSVHMSMVRTIVLVSVYGGTSTVDSNIYCHAYTHFNDTTLTFVSVHDSSRTP